MEDLVRIVIVPICILLGGFLLELLAIQARGKQKGRYKFKAWLRRPDDSLHSDSPCNINDIMRHARDGQETLVDIVELSSFEAYAGISFDLCIAAFTADVIAILNEQSAHRVDSLTASAIAIHFLLLVVVLLLVTANHRTVPEQSDDGESGTSDHWYYNIWRRWWYSKSSRRTILAILVGTIALVSSFVMLWNVL